jgi:hypothetical protein
MKVSDSPMTPDSRMLNFPLYDRMKALLYHAPGVDTCAIANSTTVRDMWAHLLIKRSGDDSDEEKEEKEYGPPTSSDGGDLDNEESETSEGEDKANTANEVLEVLDALEDDSDDDQNYEPEPKKDKKAQHKGAKRKRDSVEKSVEQPKNMVSYSDQSIKGGVLT